MSILVPELNLLVLQAQRQRRAERGQTGSLKMRGRPKAGQVVTIVLKHITSYPHLETSWFNIAVPRAAVIEWEALTSDAGRISVPAGVAKRSPYRALHHV